MDFRNAIRAASVGRWANGGGRGLGDFPEVHLNYLPAVHPPSSNPLLIGGRHITPYRWATGVACGWVLIVSGGGGTTKKISGATGAIVFSLLACPGVA